MAIIKIKDANGVDAAQIQEWDLNETIVLLCICREDGAHRIYKLHDIPESLSTFESGNNNFRWVPLFKCNNSFISAKPTAKEAIQAVINKLYLEEVVAFSGGVKEMCEYILSKDWT
jgi:plasmid rolling circle replication initiator protein Rep